ncbi:MAG: lysophospholipid acyltransferase family protein [Steroidobacteraceae bacterium]|nr:lysophospholipid acyltransferase family protein [Steroidobacteraceae bacterium]
MSDPDKAAAPAPAEFRPPLWLAVLSRLPFWFWYAMASFFAWLALYVVNYRRHVVDAQLKACFPEWDAAKLHEVKREFYRGFADVFAEIVKMPAMSADDFRERCELLGNEHVSRYTDAGQPVLLVTSHVCNWEWSLAILSLGLPCPMDAAYKPLHNLWADRLFLDLRARFGTRMIPAKKLLMDVVRRRKQPRLLGMVSDQDPVSAKGRYFTTFLGRDTAFYIGAESIARAAKMPMLFLDVERVSRGHYRLTIEPLVDVDEDLPEGERTERYARRLERAIRERPADWLWTYRRWKVKRPIYES